MGVFELKSIVWPVQGGKKNMKTEIHATIILENRTTRQEVEHFPLRFSCKITLRSLYNFSPQSLCII